MSDTLRTFRRRALPALAFAALLGCAEDFALPPAQVPIAQQQITLFALTGTQVRTASAYSMIRLAEVRVDISNDLDFAFDIRDTLGGQQAYLIPRGALGFVPDGGLQIDSVVGFDSLLLAPRTGYEQVRMMPIDSGSVLLAASRLQSCDFTIVSPRFAKLLVLSLDKVARVAVIRVVINPNCGYRSLGSGIPQQ